MIKDLSFEEYEDFSRYGSMKIKNGVHVTNLDRVIRVRNIMKKGYDQKNDHLGFGDPKKYKENKTIIEFDSMISMKTMGPPNFLKRRFKISTIDKTKNINGLFFRSAN